MRYILFILLFLIVGQVFAQSKTTKKKPFQWPKPYRDSTWIEPVSDTLYGTVEYKAGNGKVVGDGILVTTNFHHRVKHFYTKRDQHILDSLRSDQMIWISDGSWYGSQESRQNAFIKTEKGYMHVIYPFTFKPK